MQTESIAAAAGLETPSTEAQAAFLTESWDAPTDFPTALRGWLVETGRPEFKSDALHGTALYYDSVERHLGRNRAAIHWHDSRLGPESWRVLSYDELHARCTLRASSWAEQGLKPGSGLCVVLPPGVENIVSILAGFRLGCVVTTIEPIGVDYIANRIGAISPDHVSTHDYYKPLLKDLADLVLRPDGVDARSGTYSHTYAPGEPCARLLSPLRRARQTPVELSGDDAAAGALRDGAITYALRPGDALAAPGFDAEQHQPALLLAALHAGAAFVHIPDADVLRDPSLLDAHPLRSLGMTSRMCNALLERGRAKKHAWDHVFKNPEEPMDWEAWRMLIEAHDLADVAFSNVVVEAASGGALLCSARRSGKDHLSFFMNVAPAAGRPWTLLDFSRSGQRSVADVGVFAPMRGEPGEEAPMDDGYIALGRRFGRSYLYGGTVEPRRSGRVYPIPEVLAALEDCPFLDAASVTTVPAGGATLEQRFVLLGFVGDEPDSHFERHREARTAELMRMLATRLGGGLLPDDIELFPLLARRREGSVDHEWCERQYTSGALYLKSRAPAFRRVAALRAAVAGVKS